MHEICPVALQASLKAARATEHTHEGWHVEACSTHIAITFPCATGPFTKVLVYAVQVCPSCPSMKAGSIPFPSSFFASQGQDGLLHTIKVSRLEAGLFLPCSPLLLVCCLLACLLVC